MRSDLLNDNLRTRIRHLKDTRIQKFDEAIAITPSESHRPQVISGIPDQTPDADALFPGSRPSPTDTNGRFIREEPW